MSAEALAATKWQDRREAWESITDAADAETLTTHLAKETNGAVLDAALDAVARVAAPELAPALPHVVQKGLANARGATQRRGLRAVVALQQVAPNETTDALVDRHHDVEERAWAFCLREGSDDGVRPFQGVARFTFRPPGDGRGQARLGGKRRRSKSRGRPRGRAVNNSAVGRRGKCEEGRRQAKRQHTTTAAAPGSGPAAAARLAAQARHDPSAPAKAPSPEKGDDLLAALARRGVSPPYDAAFEGKWDARREKLEAVASVARACSGDGEASRSLLRQLVKWSPTRPSPRRLLVRAFWSRASPAWSVGVRWSWRCYLGCATPNWQSQASQALNDVSQIQPEVVFDDATVRAATDALAAGPSGVAACGPRVRVSMGVVCLCGVVEGASPLDEGLGRALCRGLWDAHGPFERPPATRPFGAGRAAARRRQVSSADARCEDARESPGAPTGAPRRPPLFKSASPRRRSPRK